MRKPWPQTCTHDACLLHLDEWKCQRRRARRLIGAVGEMIALAKGKRP